MARGIARGDLDTSLAAWLPVTHESYQKQFKDKVQSLRVNYSDARVGMVLPDYVTVRSISQLNANKAAFQGRIIGIDSGAGVMQRAEDAIRQYKLDFRLLPSSGMGMTSELSRAIQAKKPIVVTGWIPHWMFAKWKLRFLEDPQKVFGETERVETIIYPGLQTKAPDVVAFLKAFSWQPADIAALMLEVENGEKPAVVVDRWIKAHPEQVKQWVGR